MRDEIFEKVEIEPYLIKYTKKSIIYRISTQHIVAGRMHIIEMTTY